MRRSDLRALCHRFLSTPSARRATTNTKEQVDMVISISIHALREEGDVLSSALGKYPRQFLSTPSARRATVACAVDYFKIRISIHALREEGDVF